MDVFVGPASALGGGLRVPGDKSVSHRALLFSAVATGEAHITGLAPGEDVRSTARVLRALGAVVELGAGGAARVVGGGFDGLRAPAEPLDCGNSGTTLRLCMGLLAGRPFRATLVGDASLSRRPMERVALPLRRMGASVDTDPGGRPPVTVRGGALQGIAWQSPVASAQVKSAILLAGLQARGETRVTEPERSRDHTERMLAAMGADIRVEGASVAIRPGPLRALSAIEVPGDLSSAAFLLAAGLLCGGPGVTVEAVGLNPTRTGILDALAAMGATLAIAPTGGPEPMGSVSVARSPLRGVTLGGEDLVRAVDEVPILAVLASQAAGRTVIADAAELRVKESDRLQATARFLRDMGARVQERPDGLIIDGPTALGPARVDCCGDHRIAMAAAVAGLVGGGVTLVGAECVDVSYPGFFEALDALRRGGI